MRSDVAMPSYIRIRVFMEEKRTLKKLAQEKGTSLSGLIREAALADMAADKSRTNNRRRIVVRKRHG